jgi:predicted nuclease of restriction endonuclease-like (RecB) superfamily
MSTLRLPDDYQNLLLALKSKIRQAQVQAGLAVNQKLIELYWHLGNEIWKCQKEKGWGAKVIEHLSTDLRHEFPNMKG